VLGIFQQIFDIDGTRSDPLDPIAPVHNISFAADKNFAIL